MDLINADRRIQPDFAGTLVHPGGIGPLVLIDASDNRPVVWAELGRKRIRISLEG